MRMWMINPSLLCNKHLLGEHVECHMFAGTLKKGISIKGYLDNKLLEIHNLKERHELLAKEIIKRNMKHNSILDLPDNLIYKAGEIDIEKNIKDLKSRCKRCNL